MAPYRNISFILIVTLPLSVSVGRLGAQPGDDAPAPTAELEQVVFTERSEHSPIETQLTRLKLKLDEPRPEYTIADETFTRWVPVGYDGSEPYGLLVWVSPSPRGAPRRDWLDVLERHKLIWIGANNAGNQRHPVYRFGLALDALHNMTQQYEIDPDRIYVGGMSGGSRCASIIGMVWADLFNGALMNDGVDFYRLIPAPGHENSYYRPKFNPPPPDIFLKARQRNRYVLITGENDGNRDQTYATYGHGYTRAGFRHVTYFEVPGKGHELINAEWFEKCVIELDKPLTEPAEPEEKQVAKAPAEPRPTDREDDARQLYELANNYLNAGRKDLAIQNWQQVVEKYSDTKYAERAQGKLDENQ